MQPLAVIHLGTVGVLLALAVPARADDAPAEPNASISEPRPPPSIPSALQHEPAADERDAAAEERDEATLRGMLADYAAHDRQARLVTSWSLLAAGVAAVGTGTYLDIETSASGTFDRNRQATGQLLLETGVLLGLEGIVGIPFADDDIGLTRTSWFEQLSAYYPSDGEGGRPWARAKVEQMWKKEALHARQRTRALPVLALGLGVVEAGLGTLFLVNGGLHDPLYASMDVTLVALGVGLATWAAVASSGESRTETRLREYERAVGRPVVLDVGLGIAPAPSGAAMSVSGRF